MCMGATGQEPTPRPEAFGGWGGQWAITQPFQKGGANICAIDWDGMAQTSLRAFEAILNQIAQNTNFYSAK